MPGSPGRSLGAVSRRTFILGGTAAVTPMASVCYPHLAVAEELSAGAKPVQIDILDSGSMDDTAGGRACATDSAKDFFRVRFAGSSARVSDGSLVLQVTTPGWFNPVDGDVGTVVESDGWSNTEMLLADATQSWQFTADEQTLSRATWELVIRFQLAIGLVPSAAGVTEAGLQAALSGTDNQAVATLQSVRDTGPAIAIESLAPTSEIITPSAQELQVVLVNNNAAPATAVSFTILVGDGLALDTTASLPGWAVAVTGSSLYVVSATDKTTIRAYERKTVSLRIRATEGTQSEAAQDTRDPIRLIHAFTSNAAGVRDSESSTTVTRQL